MSQLREGIELHADVLAQLLIGPNKRKLIVLMGLPAAGKSALCDHLVKQGAVRVNRDAIRKRLYGDEAIYGDYKVVNAEYYKELKAALALGGTVVSDNVNTTIYHRKGTLSAAREAGYTDITIVWLDVPLDVCLARNAARERVVKEDVIRSMHADLQKPESGPPQESEGGAVIINNGKDREHYLVSKVRLVETMPSAPGAPPSGGGAADAADAEKLDPATAAERLKFVGDLKSQVSLLEACLLAGRDGWASQTLTAAHMLIHSGSKLFMPGGSGGATPGGAPAPTGDTGGSTDAPRKRAPRPPRVPASSEAITAQLLKMIGSRPLVTREGPLVMMSFNGHLLDKDKAERLIVPLTELVKRAHIIFVQESNVDALRVLAKATRYGLNVSHRNKRQQACGILFHPRLHWLGTEPEYHDYLLDVPGHPEFKDTMRPVVQRRVRDVVTGWVFDVLNFHGKSNLGGPQATRPIRRWQFEALVGELEKQKVKSPWQPRGDAPVTKPAETAGDATPHALLTNEGEDLPLGAVILGGDFNAPIELPETTEIEPLTQSGFVRISTPDNRRSYQYRGSGGQFDGFFVRGMDGMVVECFIPLFPEDKAELSVYMDLSDHLPVFTVIQPPLKEAAVATVEAESPVAATAIATEVVTAGADVAQGETAVAAVVPGVANDTAAIEGALSMAAAGGAS